MVQPLKQFNMSTIWRYDIIYDNGNYVNNKISKSKWACGSNERPYVGRKENKPRWNFKSRGNSKLFYASEN